MVQPRPHTSPVPNVLFRRLRDALQSVFWLVPAVVIQMDGFSDRTVILVATTTGLVWQLVHRRDLADRLVVLATFWIVLGCGMALLSGSGGGFRIGPTGAIVGVVMGLVVAEQLLRFLEGRRILRQQAEHARRVVAVPAGP